MSRFENGARPISVKGRPANNRRESLAQSIGMGMSWGGVSVGSWIRDELDEVRSLGDGECCRGGGEDRELNIEECQYVSGRNKQAD